MTDPELFTLNEQQLELLCNAKTYLLLQTFKEPTNPSAAAKKLGVPANRVHYHVKRLAAAGLLERVGRGRRLPGQSGFYLTLWSFDCCFKSWSLGPEKKPSGEQRNYLEQAAGKPRLWLERRLRLWVWLRR